VLNSLPSFRNNAVSKETDSRLHYWNVTPGRVENILFSIMARPSSSMIGTGSSFPQGTADGDFKAYHLSPTGVEVRPHGPNLYHQTNAESTKCYRT
jgi:hypothetical protein